MYKQQTIPSKGNGKYASSRSQALLKFSYHSAIGDTNEAYKVTIHADLVGAEIRLHYLACICDLDHGHCHIQLLVRPWVLAVLLAVLKGLFPYGKALSVLGHSCLHIA